MRILSLAKLSRITSRYQDIQCHYMEDVDFGAFKAPI